MKVLVGSLILAASASFVAAQQTTQPLTQAAKVMAELTAAGSRTAFKNSPFSAEEVNESVQTLADGNRIVRSSTGKFYRNSDGRVRHEMAGGVGGMMGSLYSTGHGVSILNPAIGQKYMLDTHLKTAQVIELAKGQGITIAGARALTEDEKIKAVTKLKTELKVDLKATMPLVITGQHGGSYATTITGVGQGGVASFSPTVSSKYETKTENLGTRDFEGVSAEGTRKVTTIPAGAIGNERPIEIIYERWFSKDLGLVVFSKNSDPRFGEQTYKLTNLVRSEPDPSLFSLPTGYKVISAEPSSVYRYSPKAAEVERAAVERAATRVATPAVYKVKTAETKPVPVNVVEKVKP